MGSSAEVAASFRGAGRGVVCTSVSVRGRFKLDSAGVVLTVGVPDTLGRRVSSFVDVRSGVDVEEEADEVCLMLIFGFGATSPTPPAVDIGFEGEEEFGFPSSAGFSCFGVAGPDSFSSRRLRIYLILTLTSVVYWQACGL